MLVFLDEKTDPGTNPYQDDDRRCRPAYIAVKVTTETSSMYVHDKINSFKTKIELWRKD